MSLQKGFLRAPQVKPDGWLIFSGMLLSAAITFAFYVFFIHFTEFLRHTLTEFEETIVFIEKTDAHFYSYSLALLASVIGQGFGLRLLIQNLKGPSHFKTRLSQRVSLQNIETTLWYWLFWFTKVFSALGFLYISISLQYKLNVRAELGYLFLLIPLVWFLNNWLHLYRLFRKNYHQWLLGAFGFLLISTFIFGSIRLIDYELANESMKKRFPEYKYEMQLIETMSLQKNRRSRNTEKIYLIYTKEGTKLVTENADSSPLALTSPELAERIRYSLDTHSEYLRNNIKFVLTVDVRTPLRDLLYIEEQLAIQGVTDIIHRTVQKHTKYPPEYPVFKRSGLPKRLQPPCDDVKHEVDSLRNLGYAARQIRWPEFGCYQLTWALKQNRVMIAQDKDGLRLNNRLIRKEELLSVLTALVEKYEDDLIMLYKPTVDIDFQQYITGRDIIMQSILLNRHRFANDELGVSYEFTDREYFDPRKSEKYQQIFKRFPLRILELTEWNLEFYNYLKE